MEYKWLLFDADGTLFDYGKAEAYALRTTFEQMGLPHNPGHAETYARINARIWLDFEKGLISAELLRTERFELLFQVIGIECDAHRFSERYLKNLADASELIEGAEETLRALYGKAGLMLITNGLKDVQRSRLAKSAIGHYFADVIISEEVGAAKPDGRIFDVAFASMGGPRKQEVLIIGDSLTSDMQGGDEYGIDTCWFNPERRPLDSDVRIKYEIARLQELLSVLGVARNGLCQVGAPSLALPRAKPYGGGD